MVVGSWVSDMASDSGVRPRRGLYRGSRVGEVSSGGALAQGSQEVGGGEAAGVGCGAGGGGAVVRLGAWPSSWIMAQNFWTSRSPVGAAGGGGAGAVVGGAAAVEEEEEGGDAEFQNQPIVSVWGVEIRGERWWVLES